MTATTLKGGGTALPGQSSQGWPLPHAWARRRLTAARVALGLGEPAVRARRWVFDEARGELGPLLAHASKTTFRRTSDRAGTSRPDNRRPGTSAARPGAARQRASDGGGSSAGAEPRRRVRPGWAGGCRASIFAPPAWGSAPLRAERALRPRQRPAPPRPPGLARGAGSAELPAAALPARAGLPAGAAGGARGSRPGGAARAARGRSCCGCGTAPAELLRAGRSVRGAGRGSAGALEGGGCRRRCKLRLWKVAGLRRRGCPAFVPPVPSRGMAGRAAPCQPPAPGAEVSEGGVTARWSLGQCCVPGNVLRRERASRLCRVSVRPSVHPSVCPSASRGAPKVRSEPGGTGCPLTSATRASLWNRRGVLWGKARGASPPGHLWEGVRDGRGDGAAAAVEHGNFSPRPDRSV